MLSHHGTGKWDKDWRKITFLAFYTIILLQFSFSSLCSDVDLVLNCSDPQSCCLVPPIMLKLWIFGQLVAYLQNFYSKSHYFPAEQRYDVSFFLFFCAPAPLLSVVIDFKKL
jgi:hypothetical protein